jgi:hypothetical protein
VSGEDGPVPARLKLVPDVAREVGQPLPIDVVSGTSIGAVHAAALAVWADDPQSKMKHLAARWTALSLDDVIRVDRRRTFNMIRAVRASAAQPVARRRARRHRLAPARDAAVVGRGFSPHRPPHRRGTLTAVSLTAPHVGSGATTVFYQSSSTAGSRVTSFSSAGRTPSAATISSSGSSPRCSTATPGSRSPRRFTSPRCRGRSRSGP